MALKALGPRLGGLKPRLSAGQPDAHGHNAKAEPWRAWYHTKRWKDLRLDVFVRDGSSCTHPQHEGSRLISNPRLLVCDHIKAHRGDPARFWSEANLTTLCKPCHDRHKQAAERRAQARGLL